MTAKSKFIILFLLLILKCQHVSISAANASTIPSLSTSKEFKAFESNASDHSLDDIVSASVSRRQYKESSGTNPSATFDSSPIQGNLLVAVAGHRKDAGTNSISGSGWSQHIAFDVFGGNTNSRRGMVIWTKIAGANEPSTITTNTGNGTSKLLIQEFTVTGGTFTAIDQYASNTGSTSSSTSLSTGTTSTTSSSNTLVIGAMIGRYSCGNTPNFGNGLAGSVGSNETTSDYPSMWSAFAHRTSTGTQQSTASWSSSIQSSAAIVAYGISVNNNGGAGSDCPGRVSSGLIALYDFTEGSGNIVNDISGYGTPLDLTIANTSNTSWLSGDCGLDINSSTIIQSSGPASKIYTACTATNELSVEVWAQSSTTGNGGPARLVAMGSDGPSNARNFMFGPDYSTEYESRIRTTSNPSGYGPPLNGGTPSTNLRHYVVTRSSSGLERLYIDGSLISSQTIGGNFSSWDSTFPLAIGNRHTQLDRPFLGNVYKVAIYNKDLSASEVSTNYNEGQCCINTGPITCEVADWGFDEGSGSTVSDSEGNIPNATISGATWTTRPNGGSALDFDGSNDVINVGNDSDLQTSGDVTIMMWLNPDNFSVRRNPWSKAYGGEGTITQETNGYLNFYWGSGGGNTSPYASYGSGQALPLNQWTHVAVTRELSGGTNTIKWYFNGSQTASTTSSQMASASSLNALIGDGYTNNYDGGIDDVKIFQCAMTPTEIITEMNESSGGGNCNLVTNHEFDSGNSDWLLSNHSSGTGVSTLLIDNTSQLSGVYSAEIDIDNGSSSAWHIQFYQSGLTIDASKTYNLSFRARATANRSIGFRIQEGASPWTTYYTFTQNITTSAQTYTFNNINVSGSSSIARIMFELASSTADVYLDEIIFEEVGCNGGGSSGECDSGYTLDHYGRGCSGSGIDITVPNLSNIVETTIETVYKGCDPGSSVTVSSSIGNLTLNEVTVAGGSSNVRVYRTVVNQAVTNLSATSACGTCGTGNGLQSMMVYAKRSVNSNVGYSTVTMDMNDYCGVATFSIPINTADAPRDVDLVLPLSEITDDGRYLTVVASSNTGSATATETIFGPDLSLGCCFYLMELTVPNVPADASFILITILTDGANNPNGSSCGQSYAVGGTAYTATECPCEDITSPGTIGSDESNCGSYNPANITNITLPSGGEGSYIEYQWQQRNKPCGGSYGSWVTISGAISSTYDPPTIGLTTQYRRGAKREACGPYLYSNEVTKEVIEQFTSGGTIAGDQSICSGYDPSIITSTTIPSGGCEGSTSYIWQKRDQPCGGSYSSWTNISGATAATYDPPSITQTTQYRRVAFRAGGCSPDNVISNVVTKEVVENTSSGGAIAGNQTICGTSYDPSAITSTTDPSGGCGGTEEYRWYKWERNCATGSWGSGIIISGATSLTYDPPTITTTTRYRRYARRASDCTGTNSSWVVSNYIYKYLHEELTNGGTISADQENCGSFVPATLIGTVPAGGCSVQSTTYLWQYRLGESGNWIDIPSATSKDYSPALATTTIQYRRKAVTESCGDHFSNEITILINNPPTATMDDSEFCTSESTILEPEVCESYPDIYAQRLLGGSGWANELLTGGSGLTGDGSLCFDLTDASGTTSYQMIGLNSDPNTNSSYSSIDYAMYIVPATNLYRVIIYENAVNRGTKYSSSTSYIGSTFCVRRTGSTIEYLKDGAVIYTSTVSSSATLYYDNSFHSSNVNQFARFENINLCADASDIGMTYAWSGGGSGATKIVSSAGTYTVTVTDDHGCSTTASATVTQNAPPIASATNDGPLTCANTSVTLTAGPSGLSYAWSGGGNGITKVVTTPGTYTVTVTDSNGCTDTASTTVIENTTPTNIFCERYRIYDNTLDVWSAWVNFSGVCTIEMCDNNGIDHIQFDGGPNINTGWVWTDEDGNIDSEVDEIVQFNNIGLDDAGTYTGTLTDSNGCVSTVSFNVVVHPNPVASIVDNGPITCSQNTVTLTASPSGMTYAWSGGGTGQTKTVTTTGTYTVTVTSNDGCTSTANITVTEDTTAPNANAGPDQFICGGDVVNLTATGGGTYYWSNGATTPTITVSPTSYREYHVTVTASNGCTDTDNVVVNVEQPTATPVASPDAEICPGESVVLSVNEDLGTGGLIDYSTWTTGTGSTTGFSRNGTDNENHRINALDPWGNNTVVWEARPEGNNSSDGGWNTSRFDVDHTKTYRFSVWVNRKVLGPDGRFYLGTNGYGSINGVKRVDNSVTNTNPYFEVSTSPPVYGVDRWVLVVGHVHPSDYSSTSKHPDTGVYATDIGFVEAVSYDYKWLPETIESIHRSYLFYSTTTTPRQQWVYPRVDLVDGTEPSIDDLLNGYDANAGLGDGANWHWYTGSCGGTSIGSGPEITVTPSSTTTYYVRGEGNCNNSDCDEVIVTVNTPPAAAATNNGPLTCATTSVTLTATPAGMTYAWSGGGTSQTKIVSNPGTYTVTVTDSNGCTNTAQTTVIENTTPTNVFCERYRIYKDGAWGPWNNFDANCEIEMCELDGTTDIQVDGGPDINTGWVWTDEDGNIDSEVDELVVFNNIDITDAGVYTGTLTNSIGCISSFTFNVIVTETASASISGDQLICVGETATFTSSTTGGLGTASYQWQQSANNSTWEDIPGATNANYTTAALNALTYYRLIVTWDGLGCGSATSSPSEADVDTESIALTADAFPPDICPGGSTILTVNDTIDHGGLLDYSTWTTGTGSTSGLSYIGAATENERIIDTDPWGNSTVVWEARPDGSGGGDGGWNSNSYDIDHTKLYRISVWVNRKVLGTSGRFYMGTYGYSSGVNEIKRVNGSIQTNPYFWYSASPPTSLPEDEWVLIVGHIHPSDYTGTTKHADSGRYSLNEGKMGDIHYDYQWLSTSTTAKHRTYLYYSDDVASRQQWVYPRFDVVDGTEPSIDDLLGGFDVNGGLGAGASWEWYTGSCGGTSVGSGESITVSPSTTTTYYVRGEGGDCSDSDCATVTVTVNTPPVASATNDGNITCADATSTLTALPAGMNYAWSSGGTGQTENVTTPGTYTVTVTDENGCSDTAQTTVGENVTPTNIFCERYRIYDNTLDVWGAWVSFSGDCVIEMCENAGTDHIQFDGGPNINTGWVWTDEDGIVDNEVDEIVQFSSIGADDAGIYTGVLTNEYGCVSTITFEVIVHPNPNAGATNNGPLTCDLTTVTMTATPAGMTYAWSSGGTSQTETTTTPGTYTVTVTDSNGCTDSAQTTVSQNITNPNANAGPDDIICLGEDATLTASGGGTYAWSNGLGTNASVTVSPTSTTTYTVTVTAANGCTDTDQVVVTVNPLPTANPGANGNICSGNTLTWTATNAGTGATYSWDFGTHATPATATGIGPHVVSYDIPNPGIANVTTSATVTVTSSDGCINQASDAFTILAVPQVTLTSTDLSCGIDDGTITITFLDSPNRTGIEFSIDGGATWSPGVNDNTGSYTFSNLDADTYDVDVRWGDDSCTMDVGTVILDPMDTPDASASNDGPLTCDNLSVTLTASSSTSGVTYAWSGGGSNATKSVSTPGTYTVTVTETSTGCTNTAQTVVTQNIVDPNAAATNDGPLTCANTTVNLTATSTTTGATFEWSNGATTAGTTTDMGGTYTVTVTDPNNGCTTTAQTTVIENTTPTNIYCQRYRLYQNGSWGSWVNFSGNCDIELCEDDGLTDFQFDGGPDINTGWVWTDEDGNIDSEVDEIVTFSNIGLDDAGTYTGELTDANGCVSNLSFNVIVNPNPNATVVKGRDITCSILFAYAFATAYYPEYPTYLHNSEYLSGAASCGSQYLHSEGTSPYSIIAHNLPNSVTGGNSYEFGFDYKKSGGTVVARISWYESGYVYLSTTTVTLADAASWTAGSVSAVAPPNAANVQLSFLVYGSAQLDSDCWEFGPQGSTPTYTESFETNSPYEWSGPNGYAGSSRTMYMTEPGTYTVTVTDPNTGCTDTGSVTIDLNNTPPNASASNDGPITCAQPNVTLTASSTTSGATFNWSNSLGTNATASVNTPGTYTVTVTDPSNGCTTTAQTVVTEDVDAPNASAVNDGPLTCDILSVELTASSTTPGATFVWSGGGTGTTKTVTDPGTYTVTVTDPNNGCTSTAQTIVIQNNTPTDVFCQRYRIGYDGVWESWINFSGNCEIEICENDGLYDIQFDGGPDVNTGWVWTDEDGNVDSEVDELVVFADIGLDDAGIYTGILTNEYGCESTVTFEVIVNENPEASASNDGPLTCAKTNVTLTALPAGMTYAWNGGGTAQTKIVTTPGTYTVTVTDANGCTDTAQTTVTQNVTNPTADAGANEIICIGGDATLTASGGGTYAWSNSLGSNATVTVSPNTTTTYTVTVTAANGCTDTDQVVVTVNPLPTANPGANGNLCSGNTLTWTAADAGAGASYSWNFGTHATPATATGIGPHIVSYIIPPPGIANVSTSATLTVTSSDGCVNQASDAFTILAIPQVTLTSTDLSCGNDDGTITITFLDSPNRTGIEFSIDGGATWSPGVNDNTGSYTFSNLDADTYDVDVRWGDDSCTMDVGTVILDPMDTPDASASNDGPLTCDKLSVTLTASSSTSGVTYAWSGGGSNATKSVSNPGTYTVTVTDTSTGCTSTAQTVVTQNLTEPTVSVNSPSICIGESATLTATGGGTYSWPGSLTGASISVSPTTTTNYVVTVTASNGCTSTATSTVTVNPLPNNSIVVYRDILCAPAPGYVYAVQDYPNTINTLDNATLEVGSAGCGNHSVKMIGTFPNAYFAENLSNAVTAGNTYDFNFKYKSTGPGLFRATISYYDSAWGYITGSTISFPVSGSWADGTVSFLAPTNAVNVQIRFLVSDNNTVDIDCLEFIQQGSGSAIYTEGFEGPMPYEWSGPNGFSGLGRGIYVTEPGTYHLTVTDPNTGCSAVNSTVVNEYTDPPNASASNDGPITCAQSNVTLTANSTTSGATFNWSNSLGTNATVSVNTPGTYTVTVTDPSNGCTATAQTIVSEDVDAPNASAINDGPLTCDILSVELTASSTTPGATFVWSGGGTGTTKTVTDPGTYTVTVTDPNNGCTSTAQTTVIQNNTPTTIYCQRYRLAPQGIGWGPWIDFDGNCDIVLCEDDGLTNIEFDGGPDINTGWVWTDEDGNVDSEVDEIVQFVDIGLDDAGTYTGELTDANGCVSNLSFNVIVNPNPVANASNDGPLTCAKTTVTMTATPAGMNYNWSSGGTAQTETTTLPGTYTVTVTDPSTGCTDTSQTIVSQNISNPTADAGANSSICYGEEIELIASGGGNYQWSHSGGSNANFTVSPTTTTTYTVTVTDPTNGCTDEASVTVTVNPLPTVTVSTTDATCELDNGTATAVPSGGTGPYTYDWSLQHLELDFESVFGNKIPSNMSLDSAININGTIASGYVTLDNADDRIAIPNHTVDGLNDFEISIDFYMTSIKSLNAIFSAANTSQNNALLIAYGSSTNINVYMMGTNTNYSTPTLVVNQWYTVLVKRIGDQVEVFLDGNSLGTQTMNAIAIDSDYVCLGEEQDSVDGGYDPNQALVGRIDNAVIKRLYQNDSATLTGLAPGIVTVTITDANGCSATGSGIINEIPTIISSASNNGPVTCLLPNVTLTALPAGLSYAWSGGGSNQTKTVSAAGTYTVTVTDANGCTSIAQTTVIEDEAEPNASASNDGPLTCDQTDITITANSTTTGATFVWSDGLGSDATATVNTPGTYTVTVTDPSNGCTATAQTVVTEDIDAPNASAANNGPLTCDLVSVELTASSTTPAATFAWSGGGVGATKTVTNPGTYTVTVTDPSNGCTATAQTVVTEDIGTPNVSASNDGPITCDQTDVILTATSTTSGVTFAWSGGGTGANKTVNTPGTYTVTVTDTSNGCTATAQTTVIENTATPLVTASSDEVMCSSGTTTISATASAGSGSGYSYDWDNGLGLGSSHEVTLTLTTTYTVTVTDSNGCTDTDQVTISVVSTPQSNINIQDPTICANETATMTSSVTGGTGTISYQWQSSGRGFVWTDIPGATSQDYTTPPLLSTTYYRLVVSFTGTGCDDIISDFGTVIVENPSIVISADSDQEEICLGGSATLSVNNAARNGGEIDYSNWTIGTGSITDFTRVGGSSENNRINDTDPWGYNTVVWQGEPNGNSDGDGGWNTSRFDVDNTKLYRFSVWVNRKVLGTDGKFYLGTRGYGATDGVEQISNGNTATNPYFWVSSAGGTDLLDDEWVLVVGHVFPSGHNGTTRHAESGRYSVNGGFIGNTSNDYAWLPGTTEALHRSFLYYATDNSVRQQLVYPRVDIVDGNEPSIDDLLNGFDTNNGQGTGAEFEWYTGGCGGTLVGTGSTITVNPTITTTYYVRAVGDCNTTDCQQVTVVVNNLPSSSATNDGPLTCSKTEATLTATPSGLSYEWSTNETTETITVNSPGTYHVTVTDASGCISSTSTTVTQDITPPVADAGDDEEICALENINLTATGGVTYMWSNGAGNTATVTVNPAVTTTYTVTVTATNGCTDTDEVEIIVTDYPTNPGSIEGDESMCGGYDPSTITSVNNAWGANNNPIEYRWQMREYNCNTNSYGSWSDIVGAEDNWYDPIAITTTTQYRRLAGQDGCSSSWLVSNEVTKEVIDNSTDPGTISADQSGCDSFDPDVITGTPATGGCGGTIEYQWQIRTSGGEWTDIVGATGINYNPGIVNETTEFQRLVRSLPCPFVASNIVVMTINKAEFTAVVLGSNVDCEGNCTGTINVEVNHAVTGDYILEYTFNGAVSQVGPFTQDEATITDLCAGSYSNIRVISSNTGCIDIWTGGNISISESHADWEHVTHTSDVSDCHANTCDGSFTIDANLGVTGAYTASYVYNGTTYQLGPYTSAGDIIIDGLCAGTYSDITITSVESGCTDVWPDDIVIETPDFNATVIGEIDDDCQINEGSVTLRVTNGIYPYTIEWRNEANTETGTTTLNQHGNITIYGLTGGEVYCFKVTDSNGCIEN